MIASIFTAAGYKTGLYTSPHLIDFTERIRINGQPIPLQRVVHYAKLLQSKIKKLKATFFEATTAMAFLYFAEEHVDIAVVETGLGGRLDATNILTPILSVITSIGLEHTEHLGHTIREIAKEKGGIIKSGTPCLVGASEKDAISVFRQIAEKKQSQLYFARRLSSYQVVSNRLDGLMINLKTRPSNYQSLRIGLAGRYQAQNARLAVLATEFLKSSGVTQWHLTKKVIYRGLKNVRKFSGLAGRFEVIRRHPTVIIDVAHNPDGIKTLIQSLQSLHFRKLFLIFGVMEDKDYKTMIRQLASVVGEVYAVQPNLERALAAKRISAEFLRNGIPCKTASSVWRGVQKALNRAGNGDTILIIGSHYVAGEALNYFKKHGKIT